MTVSHLLIFSSDGNDLVFLLVVVLRNDFPNSPGIIFVPAKFGVKITLFGWLNHSM